MTQIQPTLPQWGDRPLVVSPDHASHCCVIGADSSTKNAVFYSLLDSACNARCCVCDSSPATISFLNCSMSDIPMYNMNPFDRYSVAWDIAADAKTFEQKQLLATLFVPSHPQETEYATRAQRSLLTACMESLDHHAPGQWGLHHLLAAIQPISIPTVLLKSPSTKAVYQMYLERFADQATALLQMLCSKFEPFYPVAAAWRFVKNRFSISTWAASHSLFLLGNDEYHRKSTVALNRLLLRILGNTPLSSFNTPHQRTWIFLPRLEQSGQCEILPELLAQHPAKDAAVYTDMSDLQDLYRHFGSHALNVIDQFNNLALLRIADETTARWAYETVAAQESAIANNQNAPAQKPLMPPTYFQTLHDSKAGSAILGLFKQKGTPFYPADDAGDPIYPLGHQETTLSRKTILQCAPRLAKDCQFPKYTLSLLSDIDLDALITEDQLLAYYNQ